MAGRTGRTCPDKVKMSGNGLQTDNPDRHPTPLKGVGMSGCPARQSGNASAADRQPSAPKNEKAAVTSGNAASERTRRYRRRLHDQLIIVPVTVTHGIIELLLDLHWLTEGVSEDRAEIGSAIARMLGDAAVTRRQP
jgi:hypothetical protein